MLVSIIIPVYNTKTEDLTQCVESILQQTYEAFELLLVDDGSDSICVSTLDSIAQMDERIHVLHKKNEGVSVARNYGVSQSKGDYILFVDGDDILLPWVLESGLEILNIKQADVVIGRILSTDLRTNIYPQRSEKVEIESIDSQESRELFEAHILAKTCEKWNKDKNGWEFNFEGCWAHLMRREVAEKFPFVPGVAVGEDTIWAVQMIESEVNVKICLINEPWYYYIQNRYSVMNCYNPNIIKQLTAPLRILNPVFINASDRLYSAYIDWLLIKLKQIVFKYYLSKQCELRTIEKQRALKELLRINPWAEMIVDRGNLKWSVRIKLMLYRRNLMLLVYSLKTKVLQGNKRQS